MHESHREKLIWKRKGSREEAAALGCELGKKATEKNWNIEQITENESVRLVGVTRMSLTRTRSATRRERRETCASMARDEPGVFAASHG